MVVIESIVNYDIEKPIQKNLSDKLNTHSLGFINTRAPMIHYIYDLIQFDSQMLRFDRFDSM